jgi:hypothetical protein
LMHKSAPAKNSANNTTVEPKLLIASNIFQSLFCVGRNLYFSRSYGFASVLPIVRKVT